MLYLAWWSLYVDVGGHSQRRLRARPLRAMEAVLGHRMWVGTHGVQQYPRQPPTVYHFDAWSYVEAETADDALHALRTVVATMTNETEDGARDPDDDYYITSFYWTPLADFADGRFRSSGVQLRQRYVDPRPRRKDRSVCAILDEHGPRYVLTATRASKQNGSGWVEPFAMTPR